jgi:leucyl/phenylalanyl-tRNA--protein transferase
VDATDGTLDKIERDLRRTKRELDNLRLSVTHVAECLGISEREIPFHARAAFGSDMDKGTSERGWNRLCALIIGHLGITSELLLKAFARGIFPMGESADDPALYWRDPNMRAIIPLEAFQVPKTLARTVRLTKWTVHVDRDFDGVIEACADRAEGTWINMGIRRIYRALFERGHCHTVETYDGNELVGGLFGVTLGRAFFLDSMFYRASHASKVALVHLIARLGAGGYCLFDTGKPTQHMKQFGAVEIPRRRFHQLLQEALIGEADFTALPPDRPLSGSDALSMIR